MPLDVRKGYAFPISIGIDLGSGEAEPRRCEEKRDSDYRKAVGFPHIKAAKPLRLNARQFLAHEFVRLHAPVD